MLIKSIFHCTRQRLVRVVTVLARNSVLIQYNYFEGIVFNFQVCCCMLIFYTVKILYNMRDGYFSVVANRLYLERSSNLGKVAVTTWLNSIEHQTRPRTTKWRLVLKIEADITLWKWPSWAYKKDIYVEKGYTLREIEQLACNFLMLVMFLFATFLTMVTLCCTVRVIRVTYAYKN